MANFQRFWVKEPRHSEKLLAQKRYLCIVARVFFSLCVCLAAVILCKQGEEVSLKLAEADKERARQDVAITMLKAQVGAHAVADLGAFVLCTRCALVSYGLCFFCVCLFFGCVFHGCFFVGFVGLFVCLF